MKLLVTGGAGFIGSHFVRYMLGRYEQVSIVNLDLLTYAGHMDTLADAARDPRHVFVQGDIRDERLVGELLKEHQVDAIVNFAAETHVDRSIEEPGVFVRTNVLGTQKLLEAARALGVPRFVQISTDEVYGALGDTGLFTEDSLLAPNSPYSASKAGADLMARAYHRTYGMHVNITRCSNNYGPYQYPEKLIPLMIARAADDRPLPVYGAGDQVRDWLHVADHCAAVDLVLRRGAPGEIYNIGGHNERRNIEVVRAILRLMGKPESLIAHVPDRPGHDRRYAIDSAKLRALGWKPRLSFETGLAETVQWYLANESWWRAILNGEGRPNAAGENR
ncbi:dTDP-glucose 4,6-dehydratase [Paenibacillus thermoaerophilus]|uniref:dTDP-glucose 4,6-dehydratase n=1 Tax=Paenibacillus thermoaerophilus TaxID=1215385 RepID=A0ABW2V3R5_9BACL|nr:dTDP-glucose 4,6-dehydratase [Paenibacillus thermoaerophilus]TMV17435.1 dTDP-glucose 4,6-dehydratase [Paenibacillus thermoaerophilus]